MSKVWKAIQKVTYAISGFSMFAVIILIFINSLCRYIFKYSIPWCEEMTRFMFIATIFFTLNIMVANKALCVLIFWTTSCTAPPSSFWNASSPC